MQERKRKARAKRGTAKLRHPNVISLMGVELLQPPYLIVTRYVGDIWEKPLTVRRAIEQEMFAGVNSFWMTICANVADGLSYLHDSASIVHNDLKTDNVVLEKLPLPM